MPFDGVRASFAASETGSFVDEQGSSRGISNPSDYEVHMRLRSQAEMILTTGATARAENYRSSKFAPIWVVTGKPNEVRTLPLFTDESVFENRTFDSFPAALGEASSEDKKRILYEGGASSWLELSKVLPKWQLVLSAPSATGLHSAEEHLNLANAVANFEHNGQLVRVFER